LQIYCQLQGKRGERGEASPRGGQPSGGGEGLAGPLPPQSCGAQPRRVFTSFLLCSIDVLSRIDSRARAFPRNLQGRHKIIMNACQMVSSLWRQSEVGTMRARHAHSLSPVIGDGQQHWQLCGILRRYDIGKLTRYDIKMPFWRGGGDPPAGVLIVQLTGYTGTAGTRLTFMLYDGYLLLTGRHCWSTSRPSGWPRNPTTSTASSCSPPPDSCTTTRPWWVTTHQKFGNSVTGKMDRGRVGKFGSRSAQPIPAERERGLLQVPHFFVGTLQPL